MMDMVLGFWKCHGEMGLSLGKLMKAFLQIFGIFDDFSKWNAANKRKNGF